MGLLVAIVGLSWLPSLTAPLGDNHEGRVGGRFVLQVANLNEEGLRASSYGASMAPYGGSYAHHPPGPNAAQWLSSRLFGDGPDAVRVFPYLMGLLTIPAAAWLLRVVGCSWEATVMATAVLVCIPLFWIYGRLLWDHPLLFATPAAVLSLEPDVGLRRSLPAITLVALSVLMSWIGAAFALAFIGVRIARGGSDRLRSNAPLVIAWIAAMGLVAAWILQATTGEDIVGQVELRTAGGDFTFADFAERQLTWAAELLPPWLLLVVPVGVWAARRRAGVPTPLAVAAALGVGFVLLLPNGSFIHDYWTYPLLVFIVLSAGLAADALLDSGGTSRRRVIPTSAILTCTALVALLALGPFGASHFADREDAGRLAERTRPAPGQTTAWTANGVDTPRWLSVYWDVPARVLDTAHLNRAPAEDLVLTRLPLPPGLSAVEVVDHEGAYGLVRVAELRRACRVARQCGA